MHSTRSTHLDRSRPPDPGRPAAFRFPEFEVHSLDNGLVVYLARYARGPLMHQLLVTPAGGQHDPIDRAGLSSLTASMMDEGTDDHSSIDIAHRVERLGGYLASQADWDSMSASLGALAPHQHRSLELLAEISRRATYPEDELSRQRDQHLAELKRRSAQPSVQASDALAEILYAGTIYGTSLLGTVETLQGIERQDILSAAERQISPSGAALVLVGDLQPERALEMVIETFGDWQGDPIPSPPSVDAPALDGHRVTLVDRPDAPQTEIWLGQAGLPKGHPDRPALSVLNSILGGKFTSRLNLNLRERLGITYGVSSSFSQRRGPGPFVVAASVDNDAAAVAIEETLAEIRRLQDEPVTEEELADTQSYLLGIFPFTLQRIEGLADRLADLAVFDLPRDYFGSFLDQVAAVTPQDVQEMARRHLDPARLGIVAVGPRELLEGQVEPFGELRIIPFKRPEAGAIEAS